MGIDARMFVRTKATYTDQQVRRLAHDLVAAFGTDRLFVIPPGPDDWHDGKGRHAIEVIDKYEQDGPDILPEDGETFLCVHLWTRYYGKGYERGDCTTICAVAEWLESRVPGGVVWYGGDSSGVCAKPFGARQRAALRALFNESGHDNYRGGWGDETNAPKCDFCGGVPMSACGGGGGDTFFACGGCQNRGRVGPAGTFVGFLPRELKDAPFAFPTKDGWPKPRKAVSP